MEADGQERFFEQHVTTEVRGDVRFNSEHDAWQIRTKPVGICNLSDKSPQKGQNTLWPHLTLDNTSKRSMPVRVRIPRDDDGCMDYEGESLHFQESYRSNADPSCTSGGDFVFPRLKVGFAFF